MSALTAIAGILISLLFMIILVGCSYAAYQGQKARGEMFIAIIRCIGGINDRP